MVVLWQRGGAEGDEVQCRVGAVVAELRADDDDERWSLAWLS